MCNQSSCLERRYVYTCGCLFDDDLVKLKFSGTGCHKQMRDCCSKKVSHLFSISLDHSTNRAIICRHTLGVFLVLTGICCLHAGCFFINDKGNNFLKVYCKRCLRLNISIYRYYLPLVKFW